MDGSEGGGEPTVDGDVGAGDVPRGIAGEESDEAGDLVGLREASSHRSVATGPGLTVLTRMPRGPISLERALQKLERAALAAP